MKFEYKDPEFPSGLNEATDPELVLDKKDIIKFIESLKDDKMSFKIDKNDCLDWVIKQIKKEYKNKL